MRSFFEISKAGLHGFRYQGKNVEKLKSGRSLIKDIIG